MKRIALLATALSMWAIAGSARGLVLDIRYVDPAGQGFSDPDFGPARRFAFEFAAQTWGDTLEGTVPVSIAVSMDSLGGSGESALLATTFATTVHRDFPGAPYDNVYYGAALANQLAGIDLNGPDLPEIRIQLNADVDSDVVLGSINWYYGFDQQAEADIDFPTIVLHELGHGFNFFHLIRPETGEWLLDAPGIFDLFLERDGLAPVNALRPRERAKALTSQHVLWNGSYAVTEHQVPPNLFAPPRYRPGASIAHWDVTLGNQLMAPFYLAPVHAPGLLLPALVDMGWPIPQSRTSATPTSTSGFSPTPTPTPTRIADGYTLFVSNFADDTVSAVSASAGDDYRVIGSIAVPKGPLGIAAAPSGREVVAANFRAGSLTFIDPHTQSVTGVLELGMSCNQVVITSDSSTAFVSNTAENVVSKIDLTSHSLLEVLPTATRPTALSITPDDRYLLVLNYGDQSVSVISTVIDETIAEIPLNPLVLAGSPIHMGVSPDGATAYVTGANSFRIQAIDLLTLRSAGFVMLDRTYAYVGGLSFSPTGLLFVLADRMLLTVDVNQERIIRSSLLAQMPTVSAVSADGRRLFVVDALNDSISIANVADSNVFKTISVGDNPMGIAVSPKYRCGGDCNGDGEVTIDELVTGVNIAVGSVASSACIAADADRNGEVTVDELIVAVQRSLDHCA